MFSDGKINYWWKYCIDHKLLYDLLFSISALLNSIHFISQKTLYLIFLCSLESFKAFSSLWLPSCQIFRSARPLTFFDANTEPLLMRDRRGSYAQTLVLIQLLKQSPSKATLAMTTLGIAVGLEP